MDEKIKKCCPNCSQCYYWRAMDSKSKANLPLFLSCGHSMCENCITNLLKFTEPIDCKVCHQNMQVDAKDLGLLMLNQISLYCLFPVNVFMVGEITLQTIEENIDKKIKTDNEYFIDIKALVENNKAAQGLCVECHGPTSKMCEQCDIIVCNNCFNKSHKNFIIFKNHKLHNIEELMVKNACNSHKDKTLDYYCKDCMKSTCIDCLMVGGEKSCKSHNVVSKQEVNETFLIKLSNMRPKVDEMLRRLSKTAVDIGNLLTKLNNETTSSEYSNLINKIEQHFSKLTSIVQKEKDKITNRVLKLRSSEKEALIQAKDQISIAIQNANSTLNAMNALDPKKLKEVNLSVLLEDANQITKSPWFLEKEEYETSVDLTVNEDILTSISSYVQFEGKEYFKYKLYTTEELSEKNEDIPAAPTSIIYPPAITKDVKQTSKAKTVKEISKTSTFIKNVPKYRSKTGFCSSLNSITSDSSHKIYETYDQKLKMMEPFSDIPHLQPLLEGSQELIYISHIVDPHNFYVQRACLQARVKELVREFRNAASLPKPSIAHVTEEKMYLVFNKADDLWHRCRIVNIDKRDENKPLFHVFCIDFGSTEIVSINKLRLIPYARIQIPPPFAIKCSLANCEPINGSWTSDDSFFVQNIIDNQQAVILIHRVCSDGTLDVNLSTCEHGVSLAHALAFHSRARLPGKLPHPKMIGFTEKPKLFISNNDFQKNSIEEVYITHVVSPDHFYVRKRHLQSVYEKLCEDLKQEYSLSVTSGSIYLPENDMVCVASVQQTWQRAVVRELPGRGRVRALLPDTGATVLLHWNALRRLLPKFIVLRALATECHLAGVTPLNKIWSPGSVALLHKFEERVLELHVEENRKRSSLGVILYDKSDEENTICINNEMIKSKFAVTFGMFMFNKNAETDDLVFTNKSPLDVPKAKTADKDSITLLDRQSTKATKVKDEDLEAKDKGPLRLEAKVLHYQSPSLLYVSLVHQQKIFNELFEKIQNYYSKNKTQGKTNWEIGDRCCTICNQSQTWRRSAILDINGENVKVFYSDFACVETVPISSLREMPEEFASIGDAAIMCHLCGVVAAVGDEWPSLTKEYLRELLDAYKRVFITKLGNFKGKSMPVELWVYHTIQGGALEPNTSEWRCLNKKIIDQGLAIPDKIEVKNSNDNAMENAGNDMLSFLNITGSVRDWIAIETMPLKPLNVKANSDNNSSTSIEVDLSPIDSQSTEDDHPNTVFISEWLPPEPFQSTEFIGMPTYIDNDGVIYLHDVSQQDTLDLIRKALDVRFKNSDPKAKFMKWTVGEPCVALYFLDNRFYRGRVLEVNDQNSTCLIHYIDYGNEETCSFENLRKSIVLYQIPIQAHKCVLNRIRPAGNRWDRQALDYMHKSIVEKQCYIKVSGEPIQDFIPIELKYDKLWMNDHLVDFEMAVYTDGSKAVVRKFAPNIKECKKLEQSIDIEPNYIREDEDSANQSTDLHIRNVIDINWNEILTEEENEVLNRNFMSYSPYTKTEFLCEITIINEIDKLELSIIRDDETTKAYEDMFVELQTEGENMSLLNGIYENKACLALFPEDDQWYRASILQYSKAKSRIKVKYVDYGNIEILSLANVREITEKYTRLPPATITVTLHGIKTNPNLEKNILIEHYTDTFLKCNEPFHAKVIDSTNIIPSVELRDDKGNLIYDDLIKHNLLIECC